MARVNALVSFGYPNYKKVTWYADTSLVSTLGLPETDEVAYLEVDEGSSTIRMEVQCIGRHEMTTTALLEHVEEPGEVHVLASSSLKGQTVNIDGEEKTVEERLDELLVDPLVKAGFDVEVHWSSVFEPLSLKEEVINVLKRFNEDDITVVDLTHGMNITPVTMAVAVSDVLRDSAVLVYGVAGFAVSGKFKWDRDPEEDWGAIRDLTPILLDL